MTILGAVRKLFLPSEPILPATFGGQAGPAVPQAASLPVSRRTFFSFFGVGVAMLAKPDLLLPSTNRFGVTTSNMLTSGLRAEFEADYAKRYAKLQAETFYYMLMNPPAELLPNVPIAEDGAALFNTTPHKIDWNEDRELKRLAGW